MTCSVFTAVAVAEDNGNNLTRGPGRRGAGASRMTAALQMRAPSRVRLRFHKRCAALRSLRIWVNSIESFNLKAYLIV